MSDSTDLSSGKPPMAPEEAMRDSTAANSEQSLARPAAREAPTADSFTCPLCLDFIHQPIGLHCCGSSFCLGCIRSSLRSSPSCPLCRKPCYLNLQTARPNIFLSNALAALFPEETAERKAAEAANAATAGATGDARVGLFVYPFPQRGGRLQVPPPHSPVAFKFFEPRYVLMARRAAESASPFGMIASVDSPMGVTVSITSVMDLPGGQILVEGKCESRFRLLAPPEMSQGEYGLWSGLIQTVDDFKDNEQHDDDTLEGVLRDVPLSDATKAKLRRMGNKAAALVALKNVVADVIVRVLSGLSPSITTGVMRRVHGETPQAGGPQATQLERWSWYAADVLALGTVRMVKPQQQEQRPRLNAAVGAAVAGAGPAEGEVNPAAAAAAEPEAGDAPAVAPAADIVIDAATEAIMTRSTLKRLALSYAFLEMVASEMRTAAAGAEAAAAAASANGAAPGGNDGALDSFPELLTSASAARILVTLHQQANNGFPALALTPGAFLRSLGHAVGMMVLQPRTFVRQMLLNPAVSSLLVFAGIIFLLFFFGSQNRRHRGGPDDGYYL
jgi:Lon protease-like protein